jgi:hypothetical protein
MNEANMIRTLLQQPIAFHRVFVTLTGNVAAGLFLSQAWYWTIHNREDREGWFYKSQEEWVEETGLTRHEQDAARRRLRECGFLVEARRGMPARLWFRLDLSRICQALSSLPEFGKQDCRISANKIAEKRQTRLPNSGNHSYQTKTTTETTSSSSRVAKGRAAAAAAAGKNLDKVPPASRHSRAEIERYIRATKPHKAEGQIGGLARHLERTGEEDEEIAGWLGRQRQAQARATHSPTCALCQGTGWQVVPGRGARACRGE